MKGNLADLNVMVVEDHEFQRLVAEQALKGLGVSELMLAGNGKEALGQLENSQPGRHRYLRSGYA